MRFALLRALSCGIAVGIFVAVLLAAALYFDGGLEREAFLVGWIAIPYGFVGAFIGYFSHPLAKSLPSWLRDNRWVHRLVVGVAMGTLVGWPIFVSGWLLGWTVFDYMRHSGYLATSRDPLDAVRSFTAFASWVSAFAASLLSALIAPPAFKNRPLAMRSFWAGIAGAIVGAWSGAGTALLYFVVRDRLQFCLLDFGASWAAFSAGLIAGIAAAIFIRCRSRLP